MVNAVIEYNKTSGHYTSIISILHHIYKIYAIDNGYNTVDYNVLTQNTIIEYIQSILLTYVDDNGNFDDNKYFYEAEYKEATNRASSLQQALASKEEQIKKQELLLEELYKLVYHKRAWLTLSDDNIIGLQKVVDKLPSEEKGVMPKTSEEYDTDEPWGV